MSDSWHHARKLADQLQRELPEDGEVSPDLAAALERNVASALLQRRRARQTRRAALGAVGALAAAALLAAIAWPRSHEGAATASFTKRSDAPTLVIGTLFERSEGTEAARSVGTPLDRETAVFRSGPLAVIRLTPSSSVELKSAQVVVERFGKTAAFVLESGTFTAATRADDEQVDVRTADVQVHGRQAAFDVERAGSECGRTRVVARAGTIEVRSARGLEVLATGATWTDCTEPAPQPSTTHSGRTTGSDEASLERQNDVLAAAVTARRAGRTDEALRAYAELLRRWPHGTLSEVARAERMTLLATHDPAAARAAARDYLRHHPNGPAHERAQALAGEGHP